LKSGLERPKRIDNAQREITPLRFVKGFQGVDARFLELRVHKPFQQLGIEGACLLSEDDAAVTIAEVVQLRRKISLHDRRSFTGNGLAHALFIDVHKFQLLAV
jgi:hypothetical protein